ncbi:hypothetical protein QN379_14550 [Glaciimonas sp. Gout2]|uniref:hypothetical protein n=1 Tax=unclassified Glaciimonas TaxID=2644401 RepID=UPI002B22997A|nr:MULTISPECIES: hypothetical protein [unclassified Glaciimonas]MEB0013573.1 hypothetical protein [Glaciimonas sp. Cout2]MEB0083226.1 hypothetical protein [Glaciimonas sp. Gout2]
MRNPAKRPAKRQSKPTRVPYPTLLQPRRQHGQALVESILACSIFMVLVFALQWVWRFGELKQLNTEATRFAIWERTAYKSNGDADFQSLFSGDADLAPKVFRNVYLTPRGARLSQANGGGDLLQDHPDWMNTAARFFSNTFATATFSAVANSALTVTTNANKVPGGPMGFDPTHNTLTRLKLDDQSYEQVQVTGAIGLSDFITAFMQQRFGVTPPVGSPNAGTTTPTRLGSLTMVTNSWSAPPAVGSKRMFEELNPLGPSNYVGMVLNNGQYANLSQLIGGASGFGANYRVDKVGINPAQISSLVSQGMSFNYDSLKNPADLFKIFKPTDDYKETFQFKGGPPFEGDYVGVACTSNVPRSIRLTQYTQDELCPAGILRARTISMFDNPALRFVSP